MTDSRDLDVRDRELRDRVLKLEPPPLPSDALARIVARRAEGERVALPVAEAHPTRGRARALFAGAALAAAAVVIAVLAHENRLAPNASTRAGAEAALDPADASCATAGTSADSSAMRHLVVQTFGVTVACGAEPGPLMPIAVDPSRVAAGTFIYSGSTITDGVFTSQHEQSSYTISRVSWRGSPALLATRDGPLIIRVSIDSLTVSMQDLAPLHWASVYPTQHPVGALHADFDSASVSMTMTGRTDTSGTFPYSRVAARVPMEFVRALIVPALPLADGWHGSVPILPPIHPHLHSMYVETRETMHARVIGRETITVPAGSFDCWKLEVGEPGYPSFFWVSTDRHFVVRSQSIYAFGTTKFDDRSELQSVVLSGK